MQADRLDLGALRRIATRLPLGTATHAALDVYAPEGLVETLQARWQGDVGALQKYEVHGRASGLAVAARPAEGHAGAGSPGVRGASVDFDFRETGGRAKLAIAGGALELPGVFEQPVLPLDLAFVNDDPNAFYDCMAFFDRHRGLALSDPVQGRFRILATSRQPLGVAGETVIQVGPLSIPDGAGDPALAQSEAIALLDRVGFESMHLPRLRSNGR